VRNKFSVLVSTSFVAVLEKKERLGDRAYRVYRAYPLPLPVQYNLVCIVLLVISEIIKNLKVSKTLTDGPTFKFIQTGHALCNLEIMKLVEIQTFMIQI
jgi:hypothetical protein